MIELVTDKKIKDKYRGILKIKLFKVLQTLLKDFFYLLFNLQIFDVYYTSTGNTRES